MATSEEAVGLPAIVQNEEKESSDESEKDMYDFDDESVRPYAVKRARSERGNGEAKPNENVNRYNFNAYCYILYMSLC